MFPLTSNPSESINIEQQFRIQIVRWKEKGSIASHNGLMFINGSHRKHFIYTFNKQTLEVQDSIMKSKRQNLRNNDNNTNTYR